MSRTLGMIYSDREYFSIAKTFSKSIFGLEITKIDSIVIICVNSNILIITFERGKFQLSNDII